MTNRVEEHPDPTKRWRNRRRMAWICLWSSLTFPILFLSIDSNNLAQIAWPFYTFTGSVVGLYIGASAWEDKKK